MVPGRALHRLAARICGDKTLERIVEPAIADMQKEYACSGRASRRVWALLTGYVAIWEGIAALTIAAVPVFAPFYIALLTPMTLPFALPIGLTLGIAFGFSRREMSPHARRIVLVSAILVTALSFASMAYVKPVANQSFRQSVFNAIGGRGVVMKGLHEMSLSELNRQIQLAPRGDATHSGERASWVYHLTFALPVAPLVLAVLALILIGCGQPRWAVMALPVAYLILLMATEAMVYQGLPSVAGAWAPNIVLAVLAIVVASSRSSRLRESLRLA